MVSVGIPVRAQLLQQERFEIEQKSSDDAFTVISLKKEGLALVRKLDKVNDGKRTWQVLVVDTTMTRRQEPSLEINSRLQLIGYEYVPGKLFLLFRSEETNAYSNTFEILELKLGQSVFNAYTAKLELNLRITHFIVVGGNCVLGGYVNKEPVVVIFDTAANKPKVLPGFFLSETELMDVKANYNHTFNVLLVERGNREKKKLVVRTFDESGNLLVDDPVDIESDKHILSALTSSLIRDELLVVGTFSLGSSRMAAGIFSLVVDPFRDQAIHFRYFPEFQHIFDNLPPRRANKLKSRAAQRIKYGRVPDYRTNIAPYRIEETDKGFLVIAEMYNPITNMSSGPYFSNPYYPGYASPYYGGFYPYGFNPYMNRYYNSPYMYNNYSQQTAAVTMQQALLMFFDQDGRLDWDQAHPFVDMKMPALEQASDFAYTNSRIIMLHKKDKLLAWRSGYLQEEFSLESTEPIKLKNDSDVLRTEDASEGAVRHWYGNTFFVWGYQHIKNPQDEDDRNRNVFYINKVTGN